MPNEPAVVSDYQLSITRYDPTDARLGRHVRHDSRSLDFRAPEATIGELVSVRHISKIPTLDQLNIGRCTGNAGTKAMTYGPFWTAVQNVLSTTDAVADEEYADQLYSDATKIDPFPGTYPPTDTGSDGLSVAKVLKARGLISGYTHITSLAALLTTLQTQAPITGSEWRGDMFKPGPDGQLKATGNVEGGHEYLYDEIDVENQRVWIQNSWSDRWGLKGRAWLSWDDAESLLMARGDATRFVPLNQPAPTPSPTPAPTDPEATFVAQARFWANLPHRGANATFVTELRKYLRWLSKA